MRWTGGDGKKTREIERVGDAGCKCTVYMGFFFISIFILASGTDDRQLVTHRPGVSFTRILRGTFCLKKPLPYSQPCDGFRTNMIRGWGNI